MITVNSSGPARFARGNNNPGQDDDDDLDLQIFSAVDGGGVGALGGDGSLADESLDPPLGAIDFDQFDSELP